MADPFDPAERLLAAAPLEPGGRLLALEAGSGALLEGTARGAREIHFHNSDYPRHAGAAARLAAMPDLPPEKVRNILSDLPRLAGPIPPDEAWPDALEYPAASFDAVLYRLGKGTASLHAAIRIAWDLLAEGGSLFMAGHTREGVKSLAQKAEGHFGNVELLAIKSSCRLLRFRKSGTAPSEPIPDPLYFQPVRLALDLPGQEPLPYLSKPGVFAYRATDTGTALLASSLPEFRSDLEGKRVLDLGCGSGPLSLAALRLGALEVVAVDANAAAISAAKRNLGHLGNRGGDLGGGLGGLGGGLGGFSGAPVAAQVHCTNLMDGIVGDFDCILSNPPFHEGLETDYGFPGRVLDAALPRLAPGGRMLIVANQFLDYPAQAERRGAQCRTVAHESGFKVHRLSR